MLSDVSSQANLQHHLLWSYSGYLAFTISGTIYSLALGVKQGPGEGEHGEERDTRDKQGCATMESSSYYCTALGSSPQPQTSYCISYSYLLYALPMNKVSSTLLSKLSPSFDYCQ